MSLVTQVRCAGCGEVFGRPHKVGTQQIYCTRRCMARSHYANKKPRDASRECCICGNTFAVLPRGVPGRYCSTKCRNKYYRTRSPADRKSSFMRSAYGITLQRRDEIIQEQGNVCAICRAQFRSERDKHVDHCHESGVVRGVLCSLCNTGIGLLRDAPDLMRRAARYVELHQ